MANPTTNFGWVMPTATDLVTDLPADFAVFGQGVDTSLADLNGGTTGQILSKTSNTNLDFTWVAASSANYSLLNSGGTALSGTTLTVSGISGKNQLMILVVGASTGSTNQSLTIRFNTDSGNNYSRITNQQEITGTYDSTFFIPSTSTASAGIIAAQMDNDATSTMSVQMKVDGCNSAGLKPYQYSGGGSVISATAGSGPVWYSGGGLYAGTSTISSVSFVSAGTFDAGTVYIYGSA